VQSGTDCDPRMVACCDAVHTGSLHEQYTGRKTGNTMTSIDYDGDSQAQRLERMKSEFQAAQKRRRERAHHATALPDDTDDGPLMAGPADRRLTGIAAVRP
jgi:hypothetical protein